MSGCYPEADMGWLGIFFSPLSSHVLNAKSKIGLQFVFARKSPCLLNDSSFSQTSLFSVGSLRTFPLDRQSSPAPLRITLEQCQTGLLIITELGGQPLSALWRMPLISFKVIGVRGIQSWGGEGVSVVCMPSAVATASVLRCSLLGVAAYESVCAIFVYFQCYGLNLEIWVIHL